jgi:hypothetical protein
MDYQEIKGEMKKFLESYENETATYQNLWDTTKQWEEESL